MALRAGADSRRSRRQRGRTLRAGPQAPGAGADVRAPPRERRDARRPRSRPGGDPKTDARSHRCVQPLAAHAQPLRMRHTVWPAGSRSSCSDPCGRFRARLLAAFLRLIGRILGLLSPHTGSLRPIGRLLHNNTAITPFLPLVQLAPWRATSSTRSWADRGHSVLTVLGRA